MALTCAKHAYRTSSPASRIARALADVVVVEHCETLAEAVARARRSATSGQIVLLAPACASFDQFTGYDQRGDVFAALAREEVAACP